MTTTHIFLVGFPEDDYVEYASSMKSSAAQLRLFFESWCGFGWVGAVIEEVEIQVKVKL